MGRVRKYKKVKSCDPFAKASRITAIDNNHDDPLPTGGKHKRGSIEMSGEIWETDFEDEKALFGMNDNYATSKSNKKSKANEDILALSQHEIIDNELDDYSKIMSEMMARKENGMIDIQNDEEEIANRREATRVIEQHNQYSSDSATKAKEGSRYVLEGRRKGESMKQFKYRIKQETRKTLREEVHKLSATAIKKKEKLKAIETKKKEKKQAKVSKREGNTGDNVFFKSEKGHIRPSDTGGIDSFDQYRPPDEVSKTMSSSGPSKLVTITSNSTHFSLEAQNEARKATISSSARNDTKESYVPSAVAIGLTSADLEKPPDLRSFQNSFEKSKSKYMLKQQDMEKQKKAAEIEEMRKKSIAAYKKMKANRNISTL